MKTIQLRRKKKNAFILYQIVCEEKIQSKYIIA